MKKIKFAVIGCGAIAKKHLVSIKRIPDAELSCVCDINGASAKKVAEEYKVPYFTDPHKMASSCDIDIFSILTPSGTHCETVLDMVKYKKHFIVEKPISLRIEDADKMIQACDENGVNLYVAQQNRFNTPVTKLKEALDSGRMGKLVLGSVTVRWCRTQDYYNEKPWRGTWAYDGGVLTNQASHHIDMLVWLMGDVESVMSMTTTRLVNIEAEDTGVVILRFKSGALGLIEATTATRPKDLEGSISVLGEKGSVEIGGFFMNELKTWNFTTRKPVDDEMFTKYNKNPDEFAWNHTEFIKDVISSIKKSKKGLIDGLEGRKSLELINAIYESAETNKEVFLKFKPKKCRLGIKTNDKKL
ncbi:MAG: Gfo/Idh/MocA family oxidoreductase [Elusimicrobia bacterium]|nr:Gfo/Idh/MocA family oxidoreductase [Candidatus Liberimonas magnetica]